MLKRSALLAFVLVLLATGCGGNTGLSVDASGAAGTSGTGGVSGGAGTTGTAGTSGTAGTTSAAGTTGAAGSGGTTGVAGTSGGAGIGSGGAPCTLEDVNKIVMTSSTNIGCTVVGSCHDAIGSAAGLSLLGANWSANLVGHAPSATTGADPFKSKCADMGLVYLVAGSNPAKGLIIDKLDPSKDDLSVPCGFHMPDLGEPLTQAQFACVRSYFTTLTTK